MEDGEKKVSEIMRAAADYGPIRKEAVFIISSLYLAELEAKKQERVNDAAALTLKKLQCARLMDVGEIRLSEDLEFDSPIGQLWENYIHSQYRATSIETAAMLKAFNCKPSPLSPQELEVIELDRMLLLEDPRENQ